MKKLVCHKKRKKYRTFAIIGNGFDLAHNYPTLYESFVNATVSENLDIFRDYCDKDGSINTWYYFEENIAQLTQDLFVQSYMDSNGYEEDRQRQSNLTKVFAEIHRLLIQYLRSITESKPVVKLPNVKKYLNHKTMAISFNYTNVAKAYPCDIFYVHGSLDEDDILLGYDYRDEACLAQYDDMRWSKRICREALAFRRFLKHNLHLQVGSSEYDERIASFEMYQDYENSGRGIDEADDTIIPHFQLVDEFLNSYRKNGYLPNIAYNKISTIVVLGHGIEADRVFLSQIIKKCPRLKKVVIFRYAGEDDSSFDAKVEFFKPYCKRIRSARYR